MAIVKCLSKARDGQVRARSLDDELVLAPQGEENNILPLHVYGTLFIQGAHTDKIQNQYGTLN